MKIIFTLDFLIFLTFCFQKAEIIVWVFSNFCFRQQNGHLTPEIRGLGIPQKKWKPKGFSAGHLGRWRWANDHFIVAKVACLGFPNPLPDPPPLP